MTSHEDDVQNGPTERNNITSGGGNDTKESSGTLKSNGVEDMQEKIQTIQTSFLSQVEDRLSELVGDVVTEMEHVKQKNNLLSGRTEIRHRKRDPNGALEEKLFCRRDSPLTELLEVNHIKTIYNIFVAVLILFFFNQFCNNLADVSNPRFSLDLELFFYNFSCLDTVFTIWLGMITTTVLTYVAMHYWARLRMGMKKQGRRRKLWDMSFLGVYVLYLCLLLYYPPVLVVQHQLPPASSVIVLAEQVRLMMKTHAFVRSNVPRACCYKLKQDGDKSTDMLIPDFSRFLYFLFAPTLVYRDDYPRTSHVDWGYVVINFLQVLGCIFYAFFVFISYCVPVFQRFGRDPFTPRTLLLAMFGSMLPGALMLVVAFFAILHSWLNAFSEMLCFADRMFYKDWWNSTSFARFYRTWNVVVHDWLYDYVYKDLYELTKLRSKYGPMFIVFTVSSIMHEYILSVTFRFCYPVLFVMFGGFGVGMMFLKPSSRAGNIMMWVSLFAGTGLLMSLYSMEWYARINCPSFSNTFVDLFVPRSWFCDAIVPEPTPS